MEAKCTTDKQLASFNDFYCHHSYIYVLNYIKSIQKCKRVMSIGDKHIYKEHMFV